MEHNIDLNNIFQNEIDATMSSLLSLEDTSVNIEIVSCDSIDTGIKYVESSTSFNYSTFQSSIVFLVSKNDACTIEYKMLGETGELKSDIDDDMIDAIKEITSNITGAIANSINAQENEELKDVKFSVQDSKVTESLELEDCDSLLKLDISANDTTLQLLIALDTSIMKFFDDTIQENNINDTNNIQSSSNSLLNDKETDNLKLLMGIELRLSVRLGSKEMLLKDIVKLDLGDIIELDQLVNEPLDILINNTKVAEGEAVVVDGKFAVKVKNIGSAKERTSYLRIAN